MVSIRFGLLLVCGCTASADEVKPPDNQLFFPTGAAVAPDDSYLFVVNANSELRYDSGAVSVLALAPIDDVIAAWTGPDRVVPDGCAPDPDHGETLVCDEALFMSNQAGVRIGNFATDIGVQSRDPGQLRLIIPTRGDPSIAWVDWDGAALSCSSGSEGFALCDDRHRLSFVLEDPDRGIFNEPFGVFADSAGEFAMVTHLTSGAVTLVDSPRNGEAIITDVRTDFFAPDATSGARGATGVAGRTPNASGDMIYISSRSDDRVQMVTVGRPVNGAPPFMLQGNHFFLEAVGANNGGSTDTRGLAFSPSGERMYLVNRRPPSLQVYDTSLGPTGFPRNQAIGASDVCRQASTLTVSGAGDDERIYVTCFQDGQLYIIDPRGATSVEDIILVGRGPYAVTAATTRKKVFVTNFLEDTIAVVDTAAASPTRNRVVLRIGEPRAL
ncbi:MAG: hypothetical protein WKG01_28110 [Kofleriaceae bacterium]